MKKSNKDKITYTTALVLAAIFLGLVIFSIANNFDIFNRSDDGSEESMEEESILPLVQAQDVTQENQNKAIDFSEDKVEFSEDYIVLRKANTEQDSYFKCAFAEKDCVFFELQNKETGYKYYISENTPVMAEETPVFAQEQNGQIEVKGENVDVLQQYATVIPDDPESEGPNLDLAEKQMQQIYGCMPDSSICFSSGVLTLEDNELQVEGFLQFLNDLSYE